MNTRKTALATVIVLAVLGVATYASPHWQLYRMRAAVEARDAQALAGHVDFPALRASVKAQVMQRLGAGDAQADAGGNPFAAFGRAVARAMIDPIVDAAVSPEGVAAMLAAGEVRIRHAPQPDHVPGAVGSGTTDGPPEDVEPPRYELSYRAWDRVAVTRKAGEAGGHGGGAFILRRHGLWGWKLAAIELPGGAPP